MSLFSEKVNIGTRRRHNREVWLQILLPLLLGIALGGLGLAALLGGGGGSVQRGAELATVLLAIPLLVMGVIFLAAIVAMIYAVGLAMNWIPQKTVYAHRFMDQVANFAQRGADLAARPLIALESWSSAISHLTQRRLR
jgi:hypothetical protein